MSATLNYTPPNDIDGDSEDVRELSIQQLREALAATVLLTEQTIRQLKAAGVGREGEDWIESAEASNCIELTGRLSASVESAERL